MRALKRRRRKSELRREYSRSDFATLVRGKYTGRLRQRSNVVVIDPDVTDVFPSSDSVNAALRALAAIVKQTAPVRRRTS